MTHFRIKAVSGKYYITIKGKLAHPMYNQRNVTTFQNEEDLKDENIKKLLRLSCAKLCQAVPSSAQLNIEDNLENKDDVRNQDYLEKRKTT